MSQLGELVDRAVRGRALLDETEADKGHEVVEQQVFVAVRRSVVEERGGGVGHGDGLLPGATRFHVGPRRVLRPSDGIARMEIRTSAYLVRSSALCGKFPAYRQTCAQIRGAIALSCTEYQQATHRCVCRPIRDGV